MDTVETQSNPQQDRIVRVVLHKHGMGYFERRARVSGDSELKLSFRHDEMDDVLKSLAFTDAGGSREYHFSMSPMPLTIFASA